MPLQLQSLKEGVRYEMPDDVSPQFERITRDFQILGGRACERETWILVFFIVSLIVHGATVEEIMRDYPVLTREDITEALEYAVWFRPGGISPRRAQ